MIEGQRVVVVLPAYNAEATLQATYGEIDMTIVDDVLLVDDFSHDATVHKARELGIRPIILHEVNRGYGANQKTCYDAALELGADIVIMLHPDYQYTPKLIPAMAHIIAKGIYPVVLGSRILGSGALRGGMPVYKYISNRLLTLVQNLLVGQKLSEYHTGYRAFARHVLEDIDYHVNSDDFVFDNQILSQIIYRGHEIGEVTCPAKYSEAASTINFSRSVKYGLGVLWVSLCHRLQKLNLIDLPRYRKIR
jgi:glycosyltransferase involved in cell wall biosynthesis